MAESVTGCVIFSRSLFSSLISTEYFISPCYTCLLYTSVAGYTSWQRNFDRQVMKGEKGIKILAPAPYKAQEEREKIDPATQKPVIGADGKTVTETVDVLRPAFKVVSVFDVSPVSYTHLDVYKRQR